MLDTNSIFFSLQVITSNIGRILGFDKSENLLDRDGMTSMDFDTFFDIIKTDLIEQQKSEKKTGKTTWRTFKRRHPNVLDVLSVRTDAQIESFRYGSLFSSVEIVQFFL